MTEHKIIIGNSKDMNSIPNESVNLIVTSPPYPMIELWDETFGQQDNKILSALEREEGITAFNKMHDILNTIWKECDRVLCKNGFVCINVGDATRTIGKNFQLFSNHTKIIEQFLSMGYSVLPDILWRKQSNAPNKFMGSGMYPAGAYVTYEHEYILIFRKGGKREFNDNKKAVRQKSAYFWEERNAWFSDLWEIKGITQDILGEKTTRDRSGAYPFEIPYRLINMYSIEGDVILDPFVGIGTTTLACMASNRNSIGVEVDDKVAAYALDNIFKASSGLNDIINNRIQRHIAFINSIEKEKKDKLYLNVFYDFPVKTKQETAIRIDLLDNVEINERTFTCKYLSKK